MPLEFEDPQPRTQLAFFLYGPTGVGKTVGALSAPDPVLYLNGDSPGALTFSRRHYPEKDIREVRVRGRKSIEDAFLYCREGNDVATVELDTVGGIYDRVLDDLSKDRNHPTLPERGEANTFIERYVQAFLELPVNLVLVAHDMPVTVAGSEDEGQTVETMPFCGTSKPTLSKELLRPMDVVGYCGRTKSTDDEPARYVAQLVPGGGRHAKDRTGLLGEFADLNLAHWIELNEAACLAAS